jgi:asparagine synthase (glutamine-hydrolysing)
MCGIAGIADPSGMRPGDEHLVDTMLRTLAHRGPDDHVVHPEAGAVLGTRRLSIIDVAGGRQPLVNEDGSVVAAQNGEIYNYVELRRELLARGHTLRSDGDTETLVHLYEEFGERMVDHLRGMFAIAIWDAARGRLVLARDRLGKKPLYWRLAAGRLSFGSELKALLADPSLHPSISRPGLALYLAYQYVPSPLSILEDVQKLPPASVLVWDDGEPAIERYWVPEYEPKSNRSFEEDRDALLAELREAVRIRLRSDVPVGSFLSGGVDSSVITGLMAEASPQPVRTFTIGFDVPGFDETPYAEAVARHFSTRHTTEVMPLDPIGVLPELAHAFDEPFGDPSAVPTMRVAQLAGGELKVVMTGDGGDELFAGYSRYVWDRRFERLRFLPAELLGPLASGAGAVLSRFGPFSRLGGRAETLGQIVRLEPDARYDRQMRVMSPTLVKALVNGAGGSSEPLPSKPLPGRSPAARIDQLLRLDTLTYLPEDLLVKMDRATMSASLEARSPLLDQQVVGFAARLSVDRKLRDGRSKVLLREVAKMILPGDLVDRPKHGFSVPSDIWFRGPLGDRFRDTALAPDAYVREVVEPDVVARIFAEHQAGTARHGHRLWQLLSLELWGRTWMRSGVAALSAS